MIGEIGLDHHFIDDRSQYDAQLKVFEFFLSVAKEQKKIVNLHTKGAEREIIDIGFWQLFVLLNSLPNTYSDRFLSFF
jgi:Tat protein secretion system quality control protein TatD with DNase activity